MSRHLSLVADPSPGTHERRHGDCEHLAPCEWSWVKAHGSKQAACPPRCDGYNSVLRVARMQSGGGGVVMRGDQ
jgi:hypothetical protein